MAGGAILLHKPSWGPHLHRWGAAFPASPLLPEVHSIVPSARVAFAGDFVESPYPASVEGAVLSGLRTAAKLRELLIVGS
eukprot:CAMPEP_0174729202 /NCGR_PEP_ID=MMETSP1094-20130205/53257_1 /TAXON_ID=156173 /ORGANISM="Chrysochromulina brevifilum, Strain UTEX LB 985" /LENGTH=79 /DNA_ID=CAMNT_0015931267 /DNA_START=117 /DNA_END=357 /DNA_ORIENTATION=-